MSDTALLPVLFSELAPIGVFDSGVGGLSVLRAIRHALPNHPLLYVADTANAPYGDRSAAFIQERANRIASFLAGLGAQALVVACNTASVHASKSLRAQHALPVVAIEPAIKPATAMTQTGVIGVMATSQTLASNSVANLCATYGSQCRILLQACPGLAGQVDRGDLGSEVTRTLLQQYLAPLIHAGADVIVLGCTHYPFLSPLIQTLVGPGVTLLDPAAAVARELVRRLAPIAAKNIVPGDGTQSTITIFDSGTDKGLTSTVRSLWSEDVTIRSVSLL